MCVNCKPTETKNAEPGTHRFRTFQHWKSLKCDQSLYKIGNYALCRFCCCFDLNVVCKYDVWLWNGEWLIFFLSLVCQICIFNTMRIKHRFFSLVFIRSEHFYGNPLNSLRSWLHWLSMSAFFFLLSSERIPLAFSYSRLYRI